MRNDGEGFLDWLHEQRRADEVDRRRRTTPGADYLP